MSLFTQHRLNRGKRTLGIYERLFFNTCYDPINSRHDYKRELTGYLRLVEHNPAESSVDAGRRRDIDEAAIVQTERHIWGI